MLHECDSWNKWGAEAKVSMEDVKAFLEKVWKKRTKMSEREENTKYK